MNIQEQEKLYNLFIQGYSIKISSYYIDSFVHSIELDQDEKGHDFYKYNSEVYEGRSLREVSIRDVTVYKLISDWQNTK